LLDRDLEDNKVDLVDYLEFNFFRVGYYIKRVVILGFEICGLNSSEESLQDFLERICSRKFLNSFKKFKTNEELIEQLKNRD
jgi:hypothetical protein